MCWLVEHNSTPYHIILSVKLWSMTLNILHFEAGFCNKNLEGMSVCLDRKYKINFHSRIMLWCRRILLFISLAHGCMQVLGPNNFEWNYHHNIWNWDHTIMCDPEAIIHSRSTFAIWRRWPCKCLKVTMCSRNQH